MMGRLPVARTLPVRRGHEFARLQQQLLGLAYEHLLPIVRPQPPPAAAASHPNRSAVTGGCPMNKEVPDYASV
jgi:hypothetical protein